MQQLYLVSDCSHSYNQCLTVATVTPVLRLLPHVHIVTNCCHSYTWSLVVATGTPSLWLLPPLHPVSGCCHRYTWCQAFAATLRQLNELSLQREDLAENLNSQVVCELMRFTQELKTERKNVRTHTHTHTNRMSGDLCCHQRAVQPPIREQ